MPDGKVKCIDEDIPFEIPNHWSWIRLGFLFSHCSGKALNGSDKSGTEYKYITTSNLYWDRFELDKLRSMPFTDNELDKCTATKGDLLVCEGGDFGRAAIWNYDYDIKIQNHIHKLRSYYPICTRFFYYIFYLYKHIGYIGGKGIGIQGLSSGALHQIILPITSIEEQQRIVTKIEKILPIIEKYGEAQQNLDNLNSGIHDLLKKSILQEAIQGKLVEQCANDEPASKLLERIRQEKQLLVKQGKLKAKDVTDSIIIKGDDNKYYEQIGSLKIDISDKIPYDIPNNWIWVRHNQLFTISGGTQPPKSDFITESRKGFIRLYQIRDYGSNPQPVYIPYKNTLKISKEGDILLARYGASLGKVFIAKNGAYNVAIARVIPLYEGQYINKNYIYWFYNSTIYQQLIKNHSRSAQAGFNKEDLENLFFPLPPLQEQERITARIADLYSVL